MDADKGVDSIKHSNADVFIHMNTCVGVPQRGGVDTDTVGVQSYLMDTDADADV